MQVLLITLLLGLLFCFVEKRKSLWIRKKRGEFSLEMVRFLRVLVNIELDGQTVKIVELLYDFHIVRFCKL